MAIKGKGTERIVHELKTSREAFAGIHYGIQRHEIRVNDRGFEVGHWLILREWDEPLGSYTGRVLVREVTYITHPITPGTTTGPKVGPQYNWFLPHNVVVMSVRDPWEEPARRGEVFGTAFKAMRNALRAVVSRPHPPHMTAAETELDRQCVQAFGLAEELAAEVGEDEEVSRVTNDDASRRN